ncbi:MAG: hypothetical protein K1X81_07305 [Bacteroidia bacterium]|nr:hypothetical protein [Bacteroidia bacterium]
MKYLGFVCFFVLISCKGFITDEVKTTYYNWTSKKITVKLYQSTFYTGNISLAAGGDYSEMTESPPTTPYFVAVADSMVVEFEDGKKLIYTDLSSQTKNNPLSYYGYNHFESNKGHNFLYAFTDEHYLKAQ